MELRAATRAECAGAESRSDEGTSWAGFRERSAEVVPASTVIALTGAARRGNSAGNAAHHRPTPVQMRLLLNVVSGFQSGPRVTHGYSPIFFCVAGSVHPRIRHSADSLVSLAWLIRLVRASPPTMGGIAQSDPGHAHRNVSPLRPHPSRRPDEYAQVIAPWSLLH